MTGKKSYPTLKGPFSQEAVEYAAALEWGWGKQHSDLGEQIQHRGSPPNLDGLTEGKSPCSRTDN